MNQNLMMRKVTIDASRYNIFSQRSNSMSVYSGLLTGTDKLSLVGL